MRTNYDGRVSNAGNITNGTTVCRAVQALHSKGINYSPDQQTEWKTPLETMRAWEPTDWRWCEVCKCNCACAFACEVADTPPPPTPSRCEPRARTLADIFPAGLLRQRALFVLLTCIRICYCSLRYVAQMIAFNCRAAAATNQHECRGNTHMFINYVLWLIVFAYGRQHLLPSVHSCLRSVDVSNTSKHQTLNNDSTCKCNFWTHQQLTVMQRNALNSAQVIR